MNIWSVIKAGSTETPPPSYDDVTFENSIYTVRLNMPAVLQPSNHVTVDVFLIKLLFVSDS